MFALLIVNVIVSSIKYDRANRQEHLEVDPEAEVDEDDKGLYIL
jgi:hypothetical protein